MSPSLIPSLLAFFAVIAMIPVVLWLMKRAQALRPGAAGPLSIVAGLSMGPRDRIAVIHAGGRYLVVGITSQQMTLLSTLDQWPGATDAAHSPLSSLPLTNASPGAAAAGAGQRLTSFSRLLRRLDPNDSTRPNS